MVWLREKGRERHGSDLLSAGSPCFRSESDPVMFPGQILSHSRPLRLRDFFFFPPLQPS